MNGPRDYHTKRSQTQKDKHHISIIFGFLIMQINLFTRQEQTHRIRV